MVWTVITKSSAIEHIIVITHVDDIGRIRCLVNDSEVRYLASNSDHAIDFTGASEWQVVFRKIEDAEIMGEWDCGEWMESKCYERTWFVDIYRLVTTHHECGPWWSLWLWLWHWNNTQQQDTPPSSTIPPPTSWFAGHCSSSGLDDHQYFHRRAACSIFCSIFWFAPYVINFMYVCWKKINNRSTIQNLYYCWQILDPNNNILGFSFSWRFNSRFSYEILDPKIITDGVRILDTLLYEFLIRWLRYNCTINLFLWLSRFLLCYLFLDPSSFIIIMSPKERTNSSS